MKNGVVFNHLPQMKGKIAKAAGQLVRKGTFDVEAEAKRGAPVKYGLLKNSISAVTSESPSNIPPVPAAYRGRNVLFPQVGATGNPLRGLVVVGARYGIFPERGTRFMPAHAYMLPAATKVWPEWQNAWSRLEDMLR